MASFKNIAYVIQSYNRKIYKQQQLDWLSIVNLLLVYKKYRLLLPGQVGTVLSKKECDNTSYQ